MIYVCVTCLASSIAHNATEKRKRGTHLQHSVYIKENGPYTTFPAIAIINGKLLEPIHYFSDCLANRLNAMLQNATLHGLLREKTKHDRSFLPHSLTDDPRWTGGNPPHPWHTARRRQHKNDLILHLRWKSAVQHVCQVNGRARAACYRYWRCLKGSGEARGTEMPYTNTLMHTNIWR